MKKKGPRGTRLFDRRQAEIYIESVKAYREGLKASPEDSLYRRVMVQSKKQRNRKELNKEWSELDSGPALTKQRKKP